MAIHVLKSFILRNFTKCRQWEMKCTTQIHTSDISLSQYTYNLLPFSPHKKLDTELKMNTISERIKPLDGPVPYLLIIHRSSLFLAAPPQI